jgi:8-oxo-dGTP pyrophosphatase MutT (NUDIX family)
VAGYEKGTTPEGEMAHIREAFFRATTAIHAQPNARDAQEAVKALADLMRELQGEAAAFRAYEAACLMDTHRLTRDEMAAFLGVTPARVSQIISAARKRGNPVTEPLTLPEQPHVVLAIITSDAGVLVAKRRDGIPPYTFIGGEIQSGETGEQALRRKVQDEAGLTVTSVRFIGRRLHPKTSRVMVYGHVEVEAGDPQLGDPQDLEEVRWVSVDETRALMADMYGPVRQYLDELQRVPDDG